MGPLLQAVVTGAAIGAAYALVAIGFSLCWSLTRTFALAHGDIAVGSVLIAVAAVVGTTATATTPSAVTSFAVAALSIAVAAGLGSLSYVAVIRPAGRGPRPDVLTWSAGLLVIGLALRAVIAAVFPGSGVAVPDPLHLPSRALALPGGAEIDVRTLAVLGIAALGTLLLDRYLAVSSWGRRLGAVADNPALARLCGIAADRSVAAAFGLAGAAAALAGLLISPAQAVTSITGVEVGLAGAAAAVAGRIGSLRSAAVCAIGIGIAQQLILLGGGPGVTVSAAFPAIVLVVTVFVRPARPA